jgi:hypothetical protein
MRLDMFDGKSRTEIENIIDEWIVCCSNAERNRRLMKRRYIDGLTFERLSEEFELSVVQTKNIVYSMRKLLEKHI